MTEEEMTEEDLTNLPNVDHFTALWCMGCGKKYPIMTDRKGRTTMRCTSCNITYPKSLILRVLGIDLLEISE